MSDASDNQFKGSLESRLRHREHCQRSYVKHLEQNRERNRLKYYKKKLLREQAGIPGRPVGRPCKYYVPETHNDDSQPTA